MQENKEMLHETQSQTSEMTGKSVSERIMGESIITVVKEKTETAETKRKIGRAHV